MTTKGHTMTPTERHQSALNHLRKADPHPAIPPLTAILTVHNPIHHPAYELEVCDWCTDTDDVGPIWPCPTASVILEAVENA